MEEIAYEEAVEASDNAWRGVTEAYHLIIQKRPEDAVAVLEHMTFPDGVPPHVMITKGGLR
jgi:hypothetical protein